MKKLKIEIDGKKYEVLNNLGYQPSSMTFIVKIKTESCSRVAIKCRDGKWGFWTTSDRVK